MSAAAAAVTASTPQQSQQPRITVTYQDAEIRDVIAGISAFANRTIVVGRDVQGTVNAEIKDQPWGRLAVDVDNGFEPYYVVPRDKKAHISKLKSLLKDADELYLATDEDREGEAIAWHLLDELKPRGIPVKRMVFHEITKPAILAAAESPRDLAMDLVDA